MTRPPEEYSAITAPTRLIYGERTRPSTRAVIEILARAIPQAEVRGLPEAGHMSPFTHPGPVSDLLASHFDQASQPIPTQDSGLRT
jgi:pimeloyl-ACP methyl ester carboxylesterase